jgi:hypothetical protein
VVTSSGLRSSKRKFQVPMLSGCIGELVITLLAATSGAGAPRHYLGTRHKPRQTQSKGPSVSSPLLQSSSSTMQSPIDDTSRARSGARARGGGPIANCQLKPPAYFLALALLSPIKDQRPKSRGAQRGGGNGGTYLPTFFEIFCDFLRFSGLILENIFMAFLGSS